MIGRPLLALPLAALLAPAGIAQPAPAGERVLRAWAESQRQAKELAAGVHYRELARRTVNGPGQRHSMYTESSVEMSVAGLQRRLDYAEADGHPIAPERMRRMERRRAHALGVGHAWAHPGALEELSERAAAIGPARPVVREGRPAWEVPIAPDPRAGPRSRFDRGVLWFERGGAPRLVAARFERRLPAGGSAVLTAEFTRVAGIDLPLRHVAEADVMQRRRSRLFAILVRADVEYTDWDVLRWRRPAN